MAGEVLASVAPAGMQEWESKRELIRATVAQDATDIELELFFHQARRMGLDPLARQIYCVKRKGKATIQVGIDGFRLAAARTREYAGSDDAVFETDDHGPYKATVTVYRIVQGIRCAFTSSARWCEYYPGDDQGFMWKKMPFVMLAKCAEALALRKAFPAELSGAFEPAEMDQAGDALTVQPDSHGTYVTPANEAPKTAVGSEDPRLRFVTPRTDADGTIFGYRGKQKPSDAMWSKPPTDKQSKMLLTWLEKRKIPLTDLPILNAVVMAQLGYRGRDESMAATSLLIDFLMNADPDCIASVGDAIYDIEERLTDDSPIDGEITEVVERGLRERFEHLCLSRHWPTFETNAHACRRVYSAAIERAITGVEDVQDGDWARLISWSETVHPNTPLEPVQFKLHRLAVEAGD